MLPFLSVCIRKLPIGRPASFHEVRGKEDVDCLIRRSATSRTCVFCVDMCVGVHMETVEKKEKNMGKEENDFESARE